MPHIYCAQLLSAGRLALELYEWQWAGRLLDAVLAMDDAAAEAAATEATEAAATEVAEGAGCEGPRLALSGSAAELRALRERARRGIELFATFDERRSAALTAEASAPPAFGLRRDNPNRQVPVPPGALRRTLSQGAALPVPAA